MDNMNFENKSTNKSKIIVPTLIAVLTLVVLVAGATYAYVNVTSTLNFQTLTVESSIPSTGIVSITKGSNLTMALSRTQMMQGTADQTYYASTNGVTQNETTANIAVIHVEGDGTFECTYSLNVKGSPYTMATNSIGLGEGLFTLKVSYYDASGIVQNDLIDFNVDQTGANKINSATGVTYNGKITGLTSARDQYITAQLKLINSATKPQTDLQNTTATFSFTVPSFSCKATA